MKLCPSLLLLLALAGAPFLRAAEPAAPALFQPGDRWAVVGDSITHNGPYHQAIQLYYATRFPGLDLAVVNCGISGDTAEGTVKRYSWDIAPHRPTVATVMLGMNDVGRPLYNDDVKGAEIEEKRRERIETYKTKLRELVGLLQKDGARVTLILPSIFDETAELERPRQTGVAGALAECARFERELAVETGATVVDFFNPMTDLNRERQQKDSKFTVVGADRIHPGPAGHLLMAYLFLRAQQAPAEVSHLSLDVTRSAVVSASNGRTSGLEVKANGVVAFTWEEKALPFPVDPAAAAALDWVPFTQELNREILQVSGLTAARYELRIDGTAIRDYTAVELARGVNLAMENATPQARQAVEVMTLVKRRARLFSDELRRVAQVEHQSAREIAHPVTVEQMKPFIEKRLANPAINAGARQVLERYFELKPKQVQNLAQAAELAEEIRRAAQPRPHTYVLVPMK